MNTIDKLLIREADGRCLNNTFFMAIIVLVRRKIVNLNYRHVSTILPLNNIYDEQLIQYLKQKEYFILCRRCI